MLVRINVIICESGWFYKYPVEKSFYVWCQHDISVISDCIQIAPGWQSESRLTEKKTLKLNMVHIFH